MGSDRPQESPPCALCGSNDYTTLLRNAYDRIWRKPGSFDIARCERCDLVATRPRPTVDSLGFYYEDAYSGESEDGLRAFQTESWLGRAISRYRLRVIEKAYALSSDDKILDVGCSYGGFLSTALELRACEVSGIDLDEGSIEKAVLPDRISYRRRAIQDCSDEVGRYTVVTFFESLEHHADPIEALRVAYQLLAPGGVCVVEVPNYAGFWRRIFRTAWLPLLIPQHLYHFTPATLRKSMKAAGFSETTHWQTMFYPLEGVGSLGLWLAAVLKTPPPGSPVSWRTPFDLLILLVLCLLYLVVEIPSQALLTLFGLSGHQLVVSRKGASNPTVTAQFQAESELLQGAQGAVLEPPVDSLETGHLAVD